MGVCSGPSRLLFGWGALAVVLALGCGTDDEAQAGSPKPEAATAEDPSGLVSITVPAPFTQAEPSAEAHDVFFLDAEGDRALALIVDEPPLNLDSLSRTVLQNARMNSEGIEVLQNSKIQLGGLDGRRVEFIVATGEEYGEIYFVNVHTSTTEHNVQVALWGDPSKRDAINAVADGLQAGGLSFLKSVDPLVLGRFEPNWAKLPIEPKADLAPWQTLRPGTINPESVVEMSRSDTEMWFIVILTPEVELEDRSVRDVADIIHTRMAGEMKGIPPTNLTMFDEIGDSVDYRWSLTGALKSTGVAVSHRFRVVFTDAGALQMYCWGQAVDPVQSDCDRLYDRLRVRDMKQPEPDAPITVPTL